MEGFCESDEAISHLHADVVQLWLEVELAVGVKEQRAAAERAAGKAEAKLQKRREQVNLYGALTQTEERRMREQIAAARATGAFPAATEKRLQAEVGKNPYQRALLCMQMAALRSAPSEQVR